jgi:hypothetical protein
LGWFVVRGSCGDKVCRCVCVFGGKGKVSRSPEIT